MLMTNGVVAVAVYLALVNHDPMYLGAIFAFMIMTQRVTMPVIQAAQSIVQIDEARHAVDHGRQHHQPPAGGGPLWPRHPHPVCRPDRIQRGDVPLSGRHRAGARPRLFHHSRRDRLRHRRPQRVGQDDGDPTAPGAAQQLPGADQDRRQRSARDRCRSSAVEPRRRAAGEFPVPRHDPRHYRRRQTRCDVRGGRRRRPGWPVPRNSSSACRPGTRPSFRRDRPICPAASANGWRSPGR